MKNAQAAVFRRYGGEADLAPPIHVTLGRGKEGDLGILVVDSGKKEFPK
jgi:hypothetical protein